MHKVQGSAYYCRGCGGQLPDGKSAHFHPECLKADKRRRVAKRRQGEAQRFQSWLRRQLCPDCGANLSSVAQEIPGCPSETACEGSQAAKVNGNGKEVYQGAEEQSVWQIGSKL